VLLGGVLATTLAYRFLSTSKEALTARIGQEDGLTGRLSALSNGIGGIVMSVAFILGGNVEGENRVGRVLGWTGVLTLIFLGLGAWRDEGVFAGNIEAPIAPAHPLTEVRRLLAHRPFRLAVVMWLLINFTPSLLTPLLFHFTRDLHGGADDYGWFMGIFFLGIAPMSFAYAWLAKRARFKTLLVWGIAVMVPQMVPILFLHSVSQTLWLAPLLSLTGGVATCAGYELLLRTCPEGLEGSGMMLADTAFWIGWKLGDVLGASLYDRGGIAPTVWATTAVYAGALVVAMLIPRASLEAKQAASARA
jgi:Na+/melibiose symporter-like transporter